MCADIINEKFSRENTLQVIVGADGQHLLA
jgi:hypothetical protein